MRNITDGVVIATVGGLYSAVIWWLLTGDPQFGTHAYRFTLTEFLIGGCIVGFVVGADWYQELRGISDKFC